MELCCLCASHIADEERLLFLDKMLRSWVVNDVPLYISMSYTRELADIVTQNVLHWRNTYPRLHLHIEEEKRSQFEHYSILLSHLPTTTTHLIFTDDDDLWHSKRVATIHHVPFQVVLRLPHIDYEEGKISETVYSEHWDYCVPVNVLRDFLAHTLNRHHLYADVCFVKFIEARYHVTEVTKGWFYVWRRHIRNVLICPSNYQQLLDDLSSGELRTVIVATAANALSRSEFVNDFLSEFYRFTTLERDMWMETRVRRSLESLLNEDIELQNLVHG